MSRVINIREKGDFSKTVSFLKRNRTADIEDILRVYGESGVRVLQVATSKDTGKTAMSWSYKIVTEHNR